MSSLGSTLRSARERTIGGLVRQIAKDTAEESVGRISAHLVEIERIIADQGDAAGEVAEVIGRTLTRLSAEVAGLTAELSRLNERLERLEDLDPGARARSAS